MKIVLLVFWMSGGIGATSEQLEFATMGGCKEAAAILMERSNNIWAICLETGK